ncbi:ATP-grasp domain-containing protein [Chitinophaga sp. CF118]|uniref:ATP-grasp domain-containing protein n=1 Tax=Chitinophaga sp. CF118 TaxID=1884367 RepID=UPI0015A52D6F|nr:ATP-grasp domain-containing protein [Chitinophaga sp. CF118]
MNNLPTLLIPEKIDIESKQVLITWNNKGGQVKQLGKYWIKDEALTTQPIALYGNQTFVLVLAQLYSVALISPDDTLVSRLDRKWTKRDITTKTIALITEQDFPTFIKPVIPKIFIAGIFQNKTAFEQVTTGLQSTEEILVSSIVTPILAEARSFVLNGEIKDIALYEGEASLDAGKVFLTDFLLARKVDLPYSVVIDIAFNETLGWFILEFNACWGAGLNNCHAEKVIDCIISASINL